MDARERLTMHYGSSSGHWEETLLAFEQQVLREAAERIRGWAQPQVCAAYDMADAFGAADLIDPDKEGSADGA